jgi:hypothetical protein
VDYGTRYGYDQSFTLSEPLEDGQHTASVTVQNEFGLWSQPGTLIFDVRNAGAGTLTLTGSFGTDAELILTQSDAAPTLEKGDLLETVSFLAPESQNPIHGRYLLPEGREADHLQILVLTESGSWEETPFTVNGSYIVFPAESGENILALVQEAPSLLPYIGIGVGVVALAALLLTLKKKKA